jgi:hypothetical protein
MEYVLVIQFDETILTYDEVIEQENILIEGLGDLADIDGHDMGAGEINFFVVIDDEEKVSLLFEKAK